MAENFLFGIGLIVIGGLLVGGSGWPLKIMKTFNIEHWLFTYVLFGLIFLPWITMFSVCNVPLVLGDMGIKTILLANLFSLAWGFANVIFSICLVKVGFVLSSAILGGTAVALSTIIPMVFKGSGVFANAYDINSREGILSLLSIVIMVVAVVLISLSGFEKEKQLHKASNSIKKNSKLGFYILLIILSGVLSTGIFMINTYCQASIIGAMKNNGVNGPITGVAIWAVGMFAGCLVNIIYALCLMKKNKSFYKLKNVKDFTLSCITGLQFFVYLLIFGFGTLLIGAAGASIGNGVCQSLQITGGQLVGFISGEWKGVRGKPVYLMSSALFLMLVGICILSFK